MLESREPVTELAASGCTPFRRKVSTTRDMGEGESRVIQVVKGLGWHEIPSYFKASQRYIEKTCVRVVAGLAKTKAHVVDLAEMGSSMLDPYGIPPVACTLCRTIHW